MENSNFILALTLTIIAGLSTGLGGAIIIFTKKLSNRFLAASLGFSAGVMIFISLVEIFSEAQGSMVVLYGEKPPPVIRRRTQNGKNHQINFIRPPKNPLFHSCTFPTGCDTIILKKFAA